MANFAPLANIVSLVIGFYIPINRFLYLSLLTKNVLDKDSNIFVDFNLKIFV